VLDPVGGPDVLALMDALESNGRLISYGIIDDGHITLKASRLLDKNIIWQGFGIDRWLDRGTTEQLRCFCS